MGRRERGAGMENHQTTEQKRAIWQRVNPTLQPYPVTAEQQAAQDAVNVCCMGAEAQEDIDVIRGFIEEELSDRRGYLSYAAAAPTPNARQIFRRLAAEEGGHARKLMGVYYLITGQVYCPAVPLPGKTCVPGWREVLRLRYHEESCGGLNYRRASEETSDECLTEIFLELSRDEYRHARQILCLLEKQMSI